jgi:hypothetical protein
VQDQNNSSTDLETIVREFFSDVARGEYSPEAAAYAAISKLGDPMFRVAPCKLDCECEDCVAEFTRNCFEEIEAA